MTNIKKRLELLEAQSLNRKGHRPLPISYFYGEPLPADFYTSDAYLEKLGARRNDFYTQPDESDKA